MMTHTHWLDGRRRRDILIVWIRNSTLAIQQRLDRQHCLEHDEQLFAPIRAQQPCIAESAPLRPMGIALCPHVQVSRQKRFRAKTDQQLVWMSISWDNNNKNGRLRGYQDTFTEGPRPVCVIPQHIHSLVKQTMSETLITGQTSEDLLADFETLLNSGSIDFGEDHQIVIITSPSNEGLHPAAAPTSTGEILLFATPQGPADVGVQDKRRPVLGRPPVRRVWR
ncbi:hypothetical protein GOODEAATRI_024020 [Goodea atripinnis]|uniref:Uncharacterized protein n=1 Tax=Goodea atripinnis TaxID=208336 RepID=A0ABV0NQ70_9TELE